MAGPGRSWVPMLGDRVTIRPSRAADAADPASRHRGRVGTVVEYRPGGAQAVEQYAVLLNGDRVPIYFPAAELEPLTEDPGAPR